MCAPQSEPLRDVHGVIQRREEGGRRQEVTRRIKRGGIKRREIQPVINSLSVLHCPEHTGDSQSWVEKRRGREETEVEGGDRVEEEESPKGERAFKPVILLLNKNGYCRSGS